VRSIATILVCDDQELVRVLLRSALEPEGHTIVEATDGDEAIALAADTSPDVIVMDLVMPGQSGLDVLAALRSHAELHSVPVLLLTGSRAITDRDAAASFGADAYLAKPFQVPELTRTIRELLAAR
jgi:CheY-like chemotaxis protein